MERILVDTGPLVAVLSRTDQHHPACAAASRSLPRPLFTCWPVLTEAVYLLRRRHDHVRKLFGFLEHGLVECLELDAAAEPWIAGFFDRYGDRQPQLADAAIMYLAERERIHTIFTIDREDFGVYRFTDRSAPTLVPQLA